MDVFEALYTTRAMRRVKPDPIPMEVQKLILDAAIRAPSGGNSQGWRFMLVDDPAIRARIGPLYRDSFGQLWENHYKIRIEQAEATGDAPLPSHFASVPAGALQGSTLEKREAMRSAARASPARSRRSRARWTFSRSAAS